MKKNKERCNKFIEKVYNLKSVSVQVDVRGQAIKYIIEIEENNYFIVTFNNNYEVTDLSLPKYSTHLKNTFEDIYVLFKDCDLLKELSVIDFMFLDYIMSTFCTIEVHNDKKDIDNEGTDNVDEVDTFDDVSFYRKKLGKLYISEELLYTPSITEAFKVLDIRVIRAEYLVYKRCFEYYFVSKFVEDINEGCETKTYVIEVTETDFGQKIYKLKESKW